MFLGLEWVGLWLSLSQTGFSPREFVSKPAVAAEATAIVNFGKYVSLTTIVGKPLHGPRDLRAPYAVISVDVGKRVF